MTTSPKPTEALKLALERMDRARSILTNNNPRTECNWGMLDTSDLREALSQPAAEDKAGGEVAAQIIRNESGQIRICDANGDAFDMSKHIGAKFYTRPQPQAEYDRGWNDGYKHGAWASKPQGDQPAERVAQPLTIEQRFEIVSKWRGRNWTAGDIIDAVESAHGIK